MVNYGNMVTIQTSPHLPVGNVGADNLFRKESPVQAFYRVNSQHRGWALGTTGFEEALVGFLGDQLGEHTWERAVKVQRLRSEQGRLYKKVDDFVPNPNLPDQSVYKQKHGSWIEEWNMRQEEAYGRALEKVPHKWICSSNFNREMAAFMSSYPAESQLAKEVRSLLICKQDMWDQIRIVDYGDEVTVQMSIRGRWRDQRVFVWSWVRPEGQGVPEDWEENELAKLDIGQKEVSLKEEDWADELRDQRNVWNIATQDNPFLERSSDRVATWHWYPKNGNVLNQRLCA